MKCEAYFIGAKPISSGLNIDRSACPMKFQQNERSGFHRGVADLTGINFVSFSLSQSVSVVPMRLRQGVKFSFIDLKL
jgi:hypothetical protein